MGKLVIDKIDTFYYEVHDLKKNQYRLSITFYDLQEEPKEGDFIFVNEKLLQEKNTLLSFGSLDSKYGRKIDCFEDPDLLVLVTSKNKVYLKRLYG